MHPVQLLIAALVLMLAIDGFFEMIAHLIFGEDC